MNFHKSLIITDKPNTIRRLMNQIIALRSSRNKLYILDGTSELWPSNFSLMLNIGFRNLKLNLKYWNPSVKSIHTEEFSTSRWVKSNIVWMVYTIDRINIFDLLDLPNCFKTICIYSKTLIHYWKYFTYWKYNKDNEKEYEHSIEFFRCKTPNCQYRDAFSSL